MNRRFDLQMMKKISILLLAVAAVFCGCAQTAPVGKNESEKRYIEAFVQANYPKAQKTTLGSYIISSVPGTGVVAGDADTSPFVRVRYDVYDLSGNIQATTEKAVAQRIGTFKENYFYGPVTWYRQQNSLYAGLNEIVSTMKVGGKVNAIIPGWLITYDNYATAREYEENSTGTTARYELTLVDRISDIKTWEIDSIGRYIGHNFSFWSVADSLELGMYYFPTKGPTDTAHYAADSTFYINYIGRLLNGTVFDTNIKDTAKLYGLYNPKGTYAPKKVKMATELKDIKMSDNSVINGFARALKQMRHFEAGTAIFNSTWGYGTSGSGSAIPAFSPLRFDIEIVKNTSD